MAVECSITGCSKPVLARGWCSKHYNRWYNHGSPTALVNEHHGHSGRNRSSTYRIWAAMLARCYYSNHICFAEYGERGIEVCERWFHFTNFLADMGERPPGLTLDRIDNDGNYEPGNCRWTTYAVQARGLRVLTDAEVQVIEQDTRPRRVIQEEYGISRSTVGRIRARKNKYQTKGSISA